MQGTETRERRPNTNVESGLQRTFKPVPSTITSYFSSMMTGYKSLLRQVAEDTPTISTTCTIDWGAGGWGAV